MTQITITEIYGLPINGFMTGRGNTQQSHNPFSWQWEDGKLNVTIDGYNQPTVTKQEIKIALKKVLKSSGILNS